MSTDPLALERTCVECDEPLPALNPEDICSECLYAKTSPEAAHDRKELLDRLKLIKELGMPEDPAWFSTVIGKEFFGDKGKGYEAELFGMFVSQAPKNCTWPVWIMSFPGGLGFTVQLWRQRIRYKDLPVYGETRYHPDRGITYAITGAVLEASSREIAIIRKGMNLLARANDMRRAGRPLNSGFITEENKWQVLQYIIVIGTRMYRARGKVTQDAIARQFGGRFGITDKTSLYRLIKQCSKDWKRDILPKIKEP